MKLGELIRKLEAARELLGDDAKVMFSTERTHDSELNQTIKEVTASGIVWIKWWER